MKRLRTTALTAAFMLVSSCTSYDLSISGQEVVIEGQVTTESGIPIEHIRVSIESTSVYSSREYTSNIGEFSSIVTRFRAGDELTITIEDIDGEDNGGRFEKKTDVILLLDKAENIRREYRLTLSTASENSPQP